MEEIAQDSKKPGIQIGAWLEAMNVGQRTQQGVLDEIVGAVDLSRKGNGEGPQTGYGGEKSVPEVRLQRHFLVSRPFPSSSARRSLKRSGTGCWTRSSYIALS
jgi:hypothetical protein